MAKRSREETLSLSDPDDHDTSPASHSDGAEPTPHTSKYTTLDVPPTASDRSTKAMQCRLPPHKPLRFSSYAEHELHYQQHHTNRCSACRKNLPTPHFLDLHIAENHDPLTASRRDAGEKTYACFVEGCDKSCADWKKRRMHLVDKHGYPRNYDFMIVDNGIDGKRSMLRTGVDAQGHRKSSRERGSEAKRRDSSVTNATSEVSAEPASPEAGTSTTRTSISSAEKTDEGLGVNHGGTEYGRSMDELANAVSSLKMVPRSVTFGKRKGRSGFARS